MKSKINEKARATQVFFKYLIQNVIFTSTLTDSRKEVSSMPSIENPKTAAKLPYTPLIFKTPFNGFFPTTGALACGRGFCIAEAVSAW
jgi:hypothetical protein